MADNVPATTAAPTWEEFATEMSGEGREWTALLPPTVSPEKFRACAITAVKQNPDLLKCTKRSLFNAISRAAQDGMMPDGREGFINSYNSKIGKDGQNRDVYGLIAQWQPMAFGFRKRARELDDIIIDAQAVYQNDHFVQHQGDHPTIEHDPVPLGTERGAKVGAYAIYRKGNEILHREVMDYGQIEKARSKSKAPDSLMWKDFSEEGYKKTVLRRGMKTVPVSDDMASIIKRDDEENFHLDSEPSQDSVVVPPRPKESAFRRSAPQAIEARPEQETLGDVSVQREPEPVQQSRAAETTAKSRGTAENPSETRQDREDQSEISQSQSVMNAQADAREAERLDFIKDAYAELAAVTKVRDIPALQDRIINAGVMSDAEEKTWAAACDAHGKNIMAAAKAGKK